MKIIIFTLVSAILAVGLFSNVSFAEAPQRSVSDYSVKEMIDYISPQFGQDPKLISKITWCESGHKILPHDGYRGVNITGIHDATFYGWLPEYEKEVGETLDIKSSFDQLKMMSWAFKDENKRELWTTYVAYKKGGEYKFTTKNGKVYIARCK